MNSYIHLGQMKTGERAVVEGIFAEDDSFAGMYRRLLDLGFVVGATAECVGVSPCGDPKAYRIRGATVAIREDDGKHVLMRRERDGT